MKLQDFAKYEVETKTLFSGGVAPEFAGYICEYVGPADPNGRATEFCFDTNAEAEDGSDKWNCTGISISCSVFKSVS